MLILSIISMLVLILRIPADADHWLYGHAASLVPYLPDPALEQVATHVMKGLQGSKHSEDSLRIWSQALGAVG